MFPSLPPELEGLIELALDLRWTWSHTSDVVWARIDPDLWRTLRNPCVVLQLVSPQRLRALAAEPEFCALVSKHVDQHRAALRASEARGNRARSLDASIAYFSMEFGLGEALPIYSGGLGILAGDFLKAASDLGTSMVGVGLLYQRGYFRQSLAPDGGQIELYPHNDPNQLPVVPLRRDDRGWLRVRIELPTGPLVIRAWEVQVGRCRLYLLDTNDPVNDPADRGITAELYGGGPEVRLQQELVLGLGGWRLLREIGETPDICHLNEGHSAFVVLERARSFMAETGVGFDAALLATRAGNVFTTHTPVKAGFDQFDPSLILRYLGPHAERMGLSEAELLALGRPPGATSGPFNMAHLAVHGASTVNGVSELHGHVSRALFAPLFPRWPLAEIPVGHVTNGVHPPSWDSEAADRVWTRHCGKARWLDLDTDMTCRISEAPDEELWGFCNARRQQLVNFVRSRLSRMPSRKSTTAHVLDPDVLTIGFARRFTQYKRPELLLTDVNRLQRLLLDERRPMQLVVAGKAHPQDGIGRELVRSWARFSMRPELAHRVVFVPDYDMIVAEQMVQGVDLWLNLPERTAEACGTSGMKVLVNGGLNLSSLDGWWAEAHDPSLGWSLPGEGPNEDEARRLYDLLEHEVMPTFYQRDERSIPRQWVSMVRRSMAQLTGRFSTNRMLADHVDRVYGPTAALARRRLPQASALQLARTCRRLQEAWPDLRFGPLQVDSDADGHRFRLPVYLDELGPELVAVQLYADDPMECHELDCLEVQTGSIHGYIAQGTITTQRPAADYTPRMIPRLPEMRIPLELSLITWYTA